MPRFVSDRDYQFFQHINREIVEDIIDVPVILFKIILDEANVNIYGESITKPRYKGIELEAIIKYPKRTPKDGDGFGFDVEQSEVEFRFVRKLLRDVDVYPETGDIIKYNENYYEIHNINDVELIAGRPEYNNSIICEAHLTRKTHLNLEETHT